MPPPSAGGLPPPAKLTDLLTGNDRSFESGLGTWVASGLTLTRDTGYIFAGVGSSSGKAVTTTNNQYAECSIPGTFLANVNYFAIVAMSWEDTSGNGLVKLELGVPGTDSANVQMTTTMTVADHPAGTDDFWVVWAVKWRPTANRTSVKLRLTQMAAQADTWHFTHCRVLRGPTGVPTDTGTGLGWDAPPMMMYAGSTNGMVIPATDDGYASISGPWINQAGAIWWDVNGNLSVDSFDSWTGIYQTYPDAIYMWSEGVAGDLGETGMNFNPGPTPTAALWVSELSSTSLQLYSDTTDHMMQLRNRGTGGWSVSDDGTVNQKITDSFQWAFYVAGAQTTGTNKAAYFQTPEKARIDEVRIHLGTAPTGSSFIVDVNDDGTTIFTTQGNRPEIAISGTDDTSGIPDGGTSVAKDSVITIDVDQIGSTVAGSDLVVFVRGRLIW